MIYAPVPAECVHLAAAKYNEPVAILYAIVKTEGGQVGTVHKNHDGSYDVGPMQINSRWFAVLRRYQVTPHDLVRDPCLNVDTGGWILYREMRHTKNIWTAVGRYHSPNPREARRYVERVKRWYRRILASWQ